MMSFARALTGVHRAVSTSFVRSLSSSHALFSSVRPLGPKDKVPAFKGTAVVDGEFKTIEYKDYEGKWLVFFFYPLDFTFVCPTEIIAFSDRVKEFKALNAEEGGLGDMDIPVLSDFNKTVARSFGVLDEESGLAYRGLFVADPKGNIRSVGRSVDETLRIIKAFQHVEKHGEVCPADWHDDSPTIKPGVDSSKEYFSKVNK